MLQNSDDWHLWRFGGIGASEAPIIMGVSPYKTAYQLYEEKLGLADYPVNEFVTNLGHEWEAVARARFELETDIIVEPLCIEHETHPWLRASLDAANVEEEIFAEIKYMGLNNFTVVKNSNLPLPHHKPQVDMQFMVTGFKSAYYVCYNLDKEYKEITNYLTIKVVPDVDYIERVLYPKLVEFWGFIQTKTPPPMVKKDFNRIKKAQQKLISKEHGVTP